jgi:hypothetical protein
VYAVFAASVVFPQAIYILVNGQFKEMYEVNNALGFTNMSTVNKWLNSGEICVIWLRFIP